MVQVLDLLVILLITISAPGCCQLGGEVESTPCAIKIIPWSIKIFGGSLNNHEESSHKVSDQQNTVCDYVQICISFEAKLKKIDMFQNNVDFDA